MQWDALVVGFASLAIIGVFHPIVIQWEYHFGARSWGIFLVAGLALLVAALFVHGLPSYLLALTGAACLWCIVELRQQERRVQKGWFPRNPKRKQDGN